MAEPITGLNLANLDETTPEEVEAQLMWQWRARGPLYGMSATSLMIDYAPKFAKLHLRGVRMIDRGGSEVQSQPDAVVVSSQNLFSYMMYGWETGILNEFSSLRRNGMSKEQVMELVMFSQLYAGMRGLGHVYRAVGDYLPAWAPPREPLATFPAGWDVDPDAFRSGLDLSTREVTTADRAGITSWYEGTIGYVPASIAFGLKYHPEFVKVNRAKWEVAIRTLPKQVVPYLMLRHNTITQSREGLRESALLAKAWGINKKYIVQAISGTVMYFTGNEGWYAAADVVDPILEEME